MDAFYNEWLDDDIFLCVNSQPMVVARNNACANVALSYQVLRTDSFIITSPLEDAGKIIFALGRGG